MLKNNEIFAQWIDNHHAALFRHAFWMTGNRALAEDLVQETFYQAWKSRHSIADQENPLPWLITVLRRAVYKELHQARLDAAALSAQYIETENRSSDFDLDTLLDLGNGLMSLSARQRDLLLLYSLHGFTYEQISQQLHIPIGTVMSRIARARDMLRAFYATDKSEKIVPFRKRK